MRLRPFKAKDVKPVWKHAVEPLHALADPETKAEWLEKYSESYTLMDEGRALGCGGLIDRGEGIAQLWILVADYALPLSVPKYMAIRCVLDCILCDKRFTKFYAYCQQGFPAGQRFAQHCGMKKTDVGLPPLDGHDLYAYER